MSESPHADARRLGSAYVLDSRIGSGAQGEVWCAHRVSAPGEPLAVKLLRTDLADDEQVLDRFLKERATLMRVSSPYVVGVQDMVVEGATFAIVMTYVGGGDLRALLRTTGPLMPADTARVGALLARGLEAVHVAGIVHRDVKPANVLIEWGPGGAAPGGRETAPAGATQVVGIDARFTPRLADFGVARLTQTVGSSHTTAAVGTPLYMAPEVLDPHPPTPAADIYSLGVVLYEMSCGVPPFTGSPGQVLAQHARRDPGRPDGLPEPLWALLTAMLAKDPAARPTAAAVAQALEVMTTTLTGLPAAAALQAPPPSTPTARPHEWGTGPTALAGPVLPSSPSAGGASRTRDAGPVYGLMGAAGTGPTLREAAAPTVPGRLAAPDRPAVPAPAYGLTPPPPRRRRLLVLPALAIVLALAAG
ncbi:serine/threonine-protein kinase, partial [Actinomyces sp. 187325]